MTILELLFGDLVFSKTETFIDYETMYSWKSRPDDIVDMVLKQYKENPDPNAYPRPDKIAAILEKREKFLDFFRNCLVVDPAGRASIDSLSQSPFLAEPVNGLSDTAKAEEIYETSS